MANRTRKSPWLAKTPNPSRQHRDEHSPGRATRNAQTRGPYRTMAGDNNDAAEEAAPDIDDDDDEKGVTFENKIASRQLPTSVASWRGALLANAKIAKDAKETVQECVSEFISFITSEASDKCQREKRKIINGDDLLWAMSTLGFEEHVEPLKVYLHKYRETEGEKGDEREARGHPEKRRITRGRRPGHARG